MTLSSLIQWLGIALRLNNGTTLFDPPGSFLCQGMVKRLGAPASIWSRASSLLFSATRKLSPARPSTLCDRRDAEATLAPLH